MRTFTSAAVVKYLGNTKVRYSNEEDRGKFLCKHGAVVYSDTGETDKYLALPSAMTKSEAVAYLLKSSLMRNEICRDVIQREAIRLGIDPGTDVSIDLQDLTLEEKVEALMEKVDALTDLNMSMAAIISRLGGGA